MAGRKGRSGLRPNVEGMSINDIVTRSISVCYRFITDENQPIEKRADVASRFVLKRIADKVEIEMTHQLNESQLQSMMERIRNVAALAPPVIEIDNHT